MGGHDKEEPLSGPPLEAEHRVYLCVPYRFQTSRVCHVSQRCSVFSPSGSIGLFSGFAGIA
jgi:hypothetical protein